MQEIRKVFITICSLSTFALAASQTVVDTADDGSSGTLSFSTPSLNDEESHSPWIPDAMKCDACSAVAYQFYSKFTDFNKKHKSLKYNLPESEVLDITEALCPNRDLWQAYGIKEVKKVKHLSGPGLETEDIPGITAGGGQWPRRLVDLCEQFAGEIGEMEIYNEYKKNPKNKYQLKEFLCLGDGLLGSCSKPTRDEL